MIAIVRRVFGIGLILAGIFCLCWPAVGVWQLEIEDYGAKFRGSSSQALKIPATSEGKPVIAGTEVDENLGRLIRRKTEHRKLEVDGPEWENLFKRVDQSGGRLYLSAASEPLAGAAEKTGKDSLAVLLPGKYPVFLDAGLISTHSAMYYDEVPWGLTHPYTRSAPWMLGLGLLIYILLPRPKKQPGRYGYHFVRSQLGVDALSLVLGGIFLVLPLFISTQAVEHPRPLSMEGGWLVLTLICWFIALLFGFNLAVAGWYEGLSFQAVKTGIRKRNLFGITDYPYKQMLGIRSGELRLPGWLRKLAWLLLLVKPGLALAAIQGTHQYAPVVEIPGRDGRNLTIMTRHLKGWPELEKALLDHCSEFAELNEGQG